MNHLFPEVTLTQAELDIIHMHLSDPVLGKYFRMLGRQAAVQILQMYNSEDRETQFLQTIAGLQGQLTVLNALAEPSGK